MMEQAIDMLWLRAEHDTSKQIASNVKQEVVDYQITEAIVWWCLGASVKRNELTVKHFNSTI